MDAFRQSKDKKKMQQDYIDGILLDQIISRDNTDEFGAYIDRMYYKNINLCEKYNIDKKVVEMFKQIFVYFRANITVIIENENGGGMLSYYRVFEVFFQKMDLIIQNFNQEKDKWLIYVQKAIKNQSYSSINKSQYIVPFLQQCIRILFNSMRDTHVGLEFGNIFILRDKDLIFSYIDNQLQQREFGKLTVIIGQQKAMTVNIFVVNTGLNSQQKMTPEEYILNYNQVYKKDQYWSKKDQYTRSINYLHIYNPFMTIIQIIGTDINGIDQIYDIVYSIQDQSYAEDRILNKDKLSHESFEKSLLKFQDRVPEQIQKFYYLNINHSESGVGYLSFRKFLEFSDAGCGITEDQYKAMQTQPADWEKNFKKYIEEDKKNVDKNSTISLSIIDKYDKLKEDIFEYFDSFRYKIKQPCDKILLGTLELCFEFDEQFESIKKNKQTTISVQQYKEITETLAKQIKVLIAATNNIILYGLSNSHFHQQIIEWNKHPFRILDVRQNYGGTDWFNKSVMKNLSGLESIANQDYQYFSKLINGQFQQDGTTVVLLDSACYSQCSNMLKHLDKLPNVVKVGCSVPPNISAANKSLPLANIKYDGTHLVNVKIGKYFDTRYVEYIENINIVSDIYQSSEDINTAVLQLINQSLNVTQSNPQNQIKNAWKEQMIAIRDKKMEMYKSIDFKLLNQWSSVLIV